MDWENKTRRLGFGALSLILLLPSAPTLGQVNPLIGKWSLHQIAANGQRGIMYTEFFPNRTLHSQILVQNFINDYWGTYQMFPDRSQISYILTSANPPGSSILPLNIWITVSYQFQGNNTLVLTNGAETQSYIRIQ